MPIQRTLPDPTWSGVPADVVQQFAAFVAKDALQRAVDGPELYREELEEAERELEQFRRELKEANEKLSKQRTKQRQLIGKIGSRKNKVEAHLLSEIEKIHALPYVLGTRVDALGRLVVQMRISVVELNKPRDLGDFELVFAGEKKTGYYGNDFTGWDYDLNVIRFYGDDVDDIEGFRYENDEGTAYTGTIAMTEKKDFIADWKFAELVEEIYAYLVKENTPDEDDLDEEEILDEDNANFPRLVGTPESVWDGFTANPLKALQRTLECHGSTLESKLAEARTDIANTVSEVEIAKDGVRLFDTRVRVAKAALATTRTEQTEGITIEFADVVQTIMNIMGMVGVMGIRFDHEGTPVVHVRSSLFYFNRRFDVADYEITLEKAPRDDAGIMTRATRGRSREYYHPDYTPAWFCYGDRSREIKRLLADGEHVAALNVAINSLNAMNQNDLSERMLQQNYTEIHHSLVWRSTVTMVPAPELAGAVT